MREKKIYSQFLASRKYQGKPIGKLSKVELQKALNYTIGVAESQQKRIKKLRSQNNDLWDQLI